MANLWSQYSCSYFNMSAAYIYFNANIKYACFWWYINYQTMKLMDEGHACSFFLLFMSTIVWHCIMDRSAWRLAINVHEPWPLFLSLFTPISTFCLVSFLCFSYPCFFWVSSLAYLNLLGTKGYAVVVFVVFLLTNIRARTCSSISELRRRKEYEVKQDWNLSN